VYVAIKKLMLMLLYVKQTNNFYPSRKTCWLFKWVNHLL